MFDELDHIQSQLTKDLAFVGQEGFKGHCSICKEPILAAAASKYTHNNIDHVVHTSCFVCSMCTSGLEQKPFVLHDDKHLCENCYHTKVLGNCSRCGLVLSDSTVLRAGDKQYHTACFTCSSCKKPLTSKYVEQGDSPMCKECYEREHLPNCKACGKNILADEATGTIVAIEWRDAKYHQECFACNKCKRPFQDLKAVVHKDMFYCKECFEDEAKKTPS